MKEELVLNLSRLNFGFRN